MTQVERTSANFPRRQGRKITREKNNRLTISEVWQFRSTSFLTDLASDFAEQSAHYLYTTSYLQGPIVGEDNAGITTASITWVGFDASTGGSSPEDSPPRYFFDGQDVRVPVQYLNNGSRPKTFDELVTSSRSAMSGGKNPLDSQGQFIGFPAGAFSPSGYDIGGLTDYLDVSGTWNCERFSSTAPDVSDGCMIDPSPPGSPPDITVDTTWLYLTPSYEKLASGLFFIRERWIPGEWNPDIYNERA